MINAVEERKKALLWMRPAHILIGAGIIVPIIALIILLLVDFEQAIVEIVLAIIMVIILAITINTTVKARHSIPSNQVHLVMVRQGIYYSEWQSGGLHFLFKNWPLFMRYAEVSLQKIKIEFSWKEANEDTIQLADTSIEGNMLIEIQVTDPMLAHFETDGGFENGVKPLVLSTFKDYVETVLSTKSEDETRHINGPTLLAIIQGEYPDMDTFLSGRGVKLASFFFSGEPLLTMREARARQATAEHDAKTGELKGLERANIKISEIDALTKQFIAQGMDKQEAGELARDMWVNDRALEAIERTRGVISPDAFKGMVTRKRHESEYND